MRGVIGHLRQLQRQPRVLFGRPDVGDRHRQKFITGVAVARQRRIVDRDETQGLAVEHPHRMRIGLKQQAIVLLAVAQPTLNGQPFRDVTRNTKHADDAAVGVVQGSLGRQEGEAAVGGVELLLEGLGPVLCHHALVVGAEHRRLFGREDRAVVAPQHLRGGDAGAARGRRVVQQVAALAVLGEDGVGRVFDERLKQAQRAILRLQRSAVAGEGLLPPAHQPQHQAAQQRGGDADEGQAFKCTCESPSRRVGDQP